MTRRRPLSRRRRVVFSLLAVAGALGCLEALLALGGVQYARTPAAMKQAFVDDYIGWQNSTIELMHFQPHPVRMWAPVPGVGFVNADGFQGRQLPRPRSPGTLRVLFLGDSCTNAGPQGYPEQTIEALRERSILAEPLVAACGGYSTTQGLAFLAEALEWHPDVLVAYFGWNDHWVSPLPDHQFKPPGPVGRALTSTLGRLRTYQLLHRWIHPPTHGELLPHDLARIVERARVPPERFQENIRSITRTAASRGARVLWVVPPMARHIVETDKSVLIGHTDLLPAVHSHYVELLREAVAGLPAAQLVELPPFDRRTMLADGIHPSPEGNRVIAEALAGVISARAERR